MRAELFLAIVLWSLIASVVSVCQYGWDKHRARSAGRRVPEGRLLLIDAIGGWPGGLIGQQLFRHKTRKASYRVKYVVAACAHVALIAIVMRLF